MNTVTKGTSNAKSKKITAAIAASLVLCIVVQIVSGVGEIEAMTDKLIRLHVVANSDSQIDQELKLKVRDAVLDKASEITAEAENKDEAETLIKGSLSALEDAASKELADNNCSLPVSVSYERAFVDRRQYDDFKLPFGSYDTLCVRIGEAKGKNWWCVLYPSLCVSCAVSIDECGSFSTEELTVVKEPQKVKFKLFFFELFEWVKSLFNDDAKLFEN